MNKNINYLIIIFLCLAASSWANAAIPYDSLGLRTENGITYIIHEVEEKETLFGLSRRYGVEIDQIKADNPQVSQEGLKIGMQLKIRTSASAAQASTPSNAKPRSSGKTHTVVSGETLFRISQLYEVDVDALKRWNNLPSNDIEIGQVLVVVPSDEYQPTSEKPAATKASSADQSPSKTREADGKKYHTVARGETMYALTKKYGVSVDDIKKWNNLPDINLQVGQEIVVGLTHAPPAKSTSPGQAETSKPEQKPQEVYIPKPTKPIDADASGFANRVTENGFAERIEGSSDYRKYLALHKTAPLGTILTIRNEMNDITIFVRVVGKLPDTAANRETLLKLSKTACDKLGAINDRFPVEVTYYP